MGDESDVNIDALAAFGVKDMTQLMGDYGMKMIAAVSKMSAAFPGMCGTSEAQTFADWHGGALEAANSFLQDTNAGFQALSYGAIIEAANYRTGDLSQAQALQGVFDAFNPPADAAHTAASDAAETAFAASREAYFHPPEPEDDVKLPAPDPQAGVPGAPESPQEQYRQHNEKYGAGERWRPVDPNKAPEPSHGADQPMMGP